MHGNKITCCDRGLDVAALESNLQFLGGEKGTCVFPEARIIHSWSQIPPALPQMLNLFHIQAPESGVLMTVCLRVIEYDMKIAICGEKFCLS